ncbi:MAG TPA: sigma-70 family RNA polymerase sigma factor [Candidatus Baltobacteraceae bacterium]|jgi:RNA polymerase sigma factor for flagellar operon FliA|nr:sigma-70 family RNA polymerase sigma factor [Candidatus Baltobacteraceae bacterium]
MNEEHEREVRRLLPLVRSAARRMQRVVPLADHDDLIGDGSLGLIRAVGSYDPGHGIPLEKYARHVIVGAMLNGVRRMDPISERIRRSLRRMEEGRYALAQHRGSMPTYVELEATDRSFRRARMIAHRHVPLSLDAPRREGEFEIGDQGADPLVMTLRSQRARELLEAIALLPERQRRVVMMHYYGELPLSAIGRRMNVSSQRISQLHIAALQRLRRTSVAQ